ncbi:hypothetical protein BFS16_00725 [Hoylesella timonensis]|uniref:Uncharacterized protein n=1 Tax=Hoylesella timonensis TaxID=386414 RepID=A0A2K0XPI2_9BACT|nr:hypothetical protein [Hoylesella timonensis]PNP96442.1 hypothetical protein BFS16_00725 [Hoylesella timonensis]
MKKMFENKEQAIDALSKLLAQNNAQSIKLMNSVVCHVEDKETSIDVSKVEMNMPNIKNTFFVNLTSKIFTLPSITNVYLEVRKTLYEHAHGDFQNKLIAMRKDLMTELWTVAAGKTFKFDDTKSPRFYFDREWRSVIKVDVPANKKYSPIVWWHDDRCTQKGANASMGLGNCPLETQIEIFDLICQEIIK